MYYHFICKTLTHAQRVSRLLDRNSYTPQIKRLPSELRERNGCGYAVRVSEAEFRPAASLLKEAGISPLRAYGNIEANAEVIEL